MVYTSHNCINTFKCTQILWKTETIKGYLALLPNKGRAQVKLLALRPVGIRTRPYAQWQRVRADHSAETQLEMQGCVALQHFLCQNAGSGCTLMFVTHKPVQCVYLCWCRSAIRWLIKPVLFPPSWGRCPPGMYLTVSRETANISILVIRLVRVDDLKARVWGKSWSGARFLCLRAQNEAYRCIEKILQTAEQNQLITAIPLLTLLGTIIEMGSIKPFMVTSL